MLQLIAWAPPLPGMVMSWTSPSNWRLPHWLVSLGMTHVTRSISPYSFPPISFHYWENQGRSVDWMITWFIDIWRWLYSDHTYFWVLEQSPFVHTYNLLFLSSFCHFIFFFFQLCLYIRRHKVRPCVFGFWLLYSCKWEGFGLLLQGRIVARVLQSVMCWWSIWWQAKIASDAATFFFLCKFVTLSLQSKHYYCFDGANIMNLTLDYFISEGNLSSQERKYLFYFIS